MLTPLDIHNKEFHRSFRGYSEAEVDEFLDQVVRDFEALLKEKSGLDERVEDLENRLSNYQALEETLKQTLILAEATADEVRANARREAEIIIREAQTKAKEILDDAEARAQLTVREAQARVKRTQDEYEELKRQVHTFKARVRSLFMTQLDLLGDVAAEQAAAADRGAAVDRGADQASAAPAGSPASSSLAGPDGDDDGP
ncbi:MAG: DivIVA domain-containing protein [Bacillota bacterium]|nr:DivIVA domain-containing protein [Bacillota bacterium]